MTPIITSPAVSPSPVPGSLRVMSWNLLRRVGACAEDVAKLIHAYQPDLVLLQEATEDITAVQSLVGGYFFRHPMQQRIYGLAAWSPHPFPASTAIRLPASILPGRVPPRLAQIIAFQGITIANVHLSHGQFLNRYQLRHLMEQMEGPAAIIGDFNAVGPVGFHGFSDIGPRKRTHRAGKVVALRLDRCIARGLACSASQVLDKGPSDHHPMLLDMDVGARADGDGGALIAL
jgi:endonuclease/exonuclease/phosphatase family metal-dependent hydrolase